MNVVTVTLSGSPASGKSIVRSLIEDALYDHGYKREQMTVDRIGKPTDRFTAFIKEDRAIKLVEVQTK